MNVWVLALTLDLVYHHGDASELEIHWLLAVVEGYVLYITYKFMITLNAAGRNRLVYAVHPETRLLH